MSSLPECKICGKYQHHGEVVCLECLPKIIQKERDNVVDDIFELLNDECMETMVDIREYLVHYKEKLIE